MIQSSLRICLEAEHCICGLGGLRYSQYDDQTSVCFQDVILIVFHSNELYQKKCHRTCSIKFARG